MHGCPRRRMLDQWRRFTTTIYRPPRAPVVLYTWHFLIWQDSSTSAVGPSTVPVASVFPSPALRAMIQFDPDPRVTRFIFPVGFKPARFLGRTGVSDFTCVTVGLYGFSCLCQLYRFPHTLPPATTTVRPSARSRRSTTGRKARRNGAGRAGS